ncbi:MAG TPA: hypothetical protein ENK73_01335, partial [Thiomicrospira sp.]|nr:hypothetical protein [Thiomicrospira sp.]
ASKIAPLILDLYQYIDDYISELQQVVENSIDGKIFTYPEPMKEHFNDQSYVTNLEFLPDQGVLPAKVLRLMVDKLNLQATVFDRLKTVYKQISRADEWTHYKVNLSAGGFSFLSEKSYDLFSRMDIFMGLDEDILICRGQVQSLTKSGNEIFPYRIGVMFELLTVEQQRKITLFEQRRELKDAMLSVALPF